MRDHHKENNGPHGSLTPDHFRVKNEVLILVGNDTMVPIVGTFSSIAVLKHALESE